MNYSTFRFTLDIQSDISQVSLPVKLNDTGRQLLIGLTDGGNPYRISEGSMAVFSYKKNEPNQDGEYESGIFDCIIDDNHSTIRFDILPDVTSVAGVVDCEVWLYGPNGRQLASPRFILVVDERVMSAGDYPIPEENLSLIESVIVSETRRVEAEAKRVEAESARAEAESARAEAESARAEAESARVEAESARVEAEIAREEVCANAINTANSAYSLADSANATANSAYSLADSANATANSAYSLASYASTTANSAKSESVKAMEKATEVANKVDNMPTAVDATKVVTIISTYNGITFSYTSDTTFAEIAEAHSSGQVVVARVNTGGTIQSYVYSLTEISASFAVFSRYNQSGSNLNVISYKIDNTDAITINSYTIKGAASFPAPAINTDKKITETGYYHVYVYKVNSEWSYESFGVHFFNVNGVGYNCYAGDLKLAFSGVTDTLSVQSATHTVDANGKVTTTYADVTPSYTICTAKVG